VRSQNNRPRCEDPLELLPRVISKLYSIWVGLVYPFASKGRNLSIHFTSQLSRQKAPAISLGNSVLLQKRAWLNVADDLQNRTRGPAILIDDNCSIGNDSIVSAKNRIHLERDVLVAQSVLIMDHSHKYEDITIPIIAQGIAEGGGIRIGQGCWIGHGAAIICNRGELVLGRNCIVGANAVVTRSFPPYSVVAGNPARIVKQFEPVTKVWSSVRPVEWTAAPLS
jgi:acetyltransferase-like isoleucine patch superfamily enzyme